MLALVAIQACSGAAARNSGAASGGGAPLELYEGTPKLLFSDSIEIDSLLLGSGSPANSRDRWIGQRFAEADWVCAMRVSTVTGSGPNSSGLLELDMVPTEPPLGGLHPDRAAPIRVTVPSTSAAAAAMRSGAIQLVGSRFLLFVKEFEPSEGVSTHWFAVPDNPAQRQALASARTLFELSH